MQPITRNQQPLGPDTETGDTPPAIHADALHVGYGKHPVLHDVSVRVRPGSITGLIGPNGSGKSTLLRTLARLIRPQQGEVYLQGRPITRLPPKRIARLLAVMPQSPIPPPGVTVRELVGYGRSPFNHWYKPAPASDQHLLDAMIRRCDLNHLEARLVHTLSGGERQRAWIAMALAQQPAVMLLDEPVSALDIGHQLEVMDLLTQVNREQGTTMVIVLHDLNLASRYCDELVALHEGRVVSAGPAQAVLNADTLRRCFNVQAQFLTPPGGGCAVCTFNRVDGS